MATPLFLQLYSLRRETAVDAEMVVRRVASLGFDGVELAGDYGWSAEHWQTELAGTGLSVVSAHAGLEKLEGDLAATLAFHRAIGTDRLVVGSLPRAEQTPERYRAGARRLNAAGQRLRDEGFRLAYHNHDFEFAPLGAAGCGMDILLAETDPALVRFELDTFWLEFAGRDAVQFIQEHAARVELIHAKDLRRSDRQDVPAGQGDVDFAALLPLCEANDWPVILEYEGPDAIEGVRRGAAHLRGLAR